MPYRPDLQELAAERGRDVLYHRLYIPDNGVPSAERMAEILSLLDVAEQAGHTVYLHCWGGVGRTGTVVGCYLVRHGDSGEDALRKVGEYFGKMSPDKRRKHRHTGSPQTEAQREFVRRWEELDPLRQLVASTDLRATGAVEELLVEHGSARAALKHMQAEAQREREELSVLHRMAGPLGAQATRAEIVRRLEALAAEEITAMTDRVASHASSFFRVQTGRSARTTIQHFTARESTLTFSFARSSSARSFASVRCFP